MSIMHAEPEMLAATAGELQSINAVARAGNAAVAGPTTGVVPAAADLVSLPANRLPVCRACTAVPGD